MQLSSFPSFPDFSAGVAVGTPAAPGVGPAAPAATATAGFGELLSAESKLVPTGGTATAASVLPGLMAPGVFASNVEPAVALAGTLPADVIAMGDADAIGDNDASGLPNPTGTSAAAPGTLAESEGPRGTFVAGNARLTPTVIAEAGTAERLPVPARGGARAQGAARGSSRSDSTELPSAPASGSAASSRSSTPSLAEGETAIQNPAQVSLLADAAAVALFPGSAAQQDAAALWLASNNAATPVASPPAEIESIEISLRFQTGAETLPSLDSASTGAASEVASASVGDQLRAMGTVSTKTQASVTNAGAEGMPTASAGEFPVATGPAPAAVKLPANTPTATDQGAGRAAAAMNDIELAATPRPSRAGAAVGGEIPVVAQSPVLRARGASVPRVEAVATAPTGEAPSGPEASAVQPAPVFSEDATSATGRPAVTTTAASRAQPATVGADSLPAAKTNAEPAQPAVPALPLATSVSTETATEEGVVETIDEPSTRPVNLSESKTSLTATMREGSAAEKFAAASAESGGHRNDDNRQSRKQSQASVQQSVKTAHAGIGTNAAKSESHMPVSAHLPPPSTAEAQAVSFAAVPLTFDAVVEGAQSQTGETMNSARRAVESALATIDLFGKGEQRGVNLQFSISGQDVAVRVEMRHDGVHTTFQTDSPELRSALAQEWQSVIATQPTERSPRLAEPVFTSHSNPAATAGDSGASQQRESHARQSQWENRPTFASPGGSRPSADFSSPETSRVRSSRPSTTRHLDAVA